MGAGATGDRGAGRGTGMVGDGAFNASFGEPGDSNADFRAFVQVLLGLTLPFALDKGATFQYNVPEHGGSLQHWRVCVDRGSQRIP